MRHHSHLNTAVTIIGKYKGQEPLAAFLKKFFAAEKKYGSGDRKSIAALCYAYYRLGKINMDVTKEERIITAVFLCNEQPLAFLEALRLEWNANVHLPLPEKWAMCEMNGDLTQIFPWKKELSDGIDAPAFNLSFLQQPDLFLRVRRGREQVVKEKLDASGMPYRWIGSNTIALPNSSKIDPVIRLNREAVVQDLNSQLVLDPLLQHAAFPVSVSAWDCCAASGGKSILLLDKLIRKIDLTVSDIRESTLVNLSERFAEAGIGKYRSFVADLISPDLILPKEAYDLIICDAPCTGSGTWSRTPEQLYFFDPATAVDLAALQKRIAGNVIPSLKKGGFFVYITCSVFRAENEDVVSAIRENHRSLELLDSRILAGYEQKADSMFTAVFRKN